jgi:tetratricopeptide (TPR) repeat protein
VADDKKLGDYLRTLSHDELVDLLLSAAADDEKLDHRLRLAAEGSSNVAMLRSEVDAVLGSPGWLDYRDAIEFAREGDDIVDALKRAVKSTATGNSDLIDVVELAIEHVVEAQQHADDSSGNIGYLADQLLEVHAQACRRGKADQLELAAWLAWFTLHDHTYVTIEVRTYARALGKPGIAAYREAISQRLDNAPDDFSARGAAQRIAVFDRDPDAVVRLFGGDLDSVLDFARVAEAMFEIKRYDEALAFARRGMELPAMWQSRKLFDVAASVHTQAGDVDEVAAVRLSGLTVLPDLESYEALRDAASKTGQWPKLRTTALAELAARAPHEHVEALLSDDAVDEAWVAATAGKGGAESDTMRQLVELRAKTHPADAIPYLRGFAEEALRGANRAAYQVSVRWLVALRTANERAGTATDFTAYVAKLREANSRRPAFLDELRKARLV